LRLAHIHITRYGAEQALQNIQTQLRKYVMHIGAEDKHHATLAVVVVRIMDHFMRESKSSEFDQLISEFPRLPNDFKALVNAHYTFDIFNSEKAKREFVAPDLLSFA